MKSNKHAGQFKLKGKKAIHLTCGCCTIENWKEECREKEQRKEMFDAKRGFDPADTKEQAILYMDLRKELYG